LNRFKGVLARRGHRDINDVNDQEIAQRMFLGAIDLIGEQLPTNEEIRLLNDTTRYAELVIDKRRAWK
jgi:hypothetical protein